MDRLQFAIQASARQVCVTRQNLLSEIDFLKRRLQDATDALNRDENPSHCGIVQSCGSKIDALAAQMNAELRAHHDLIGIAKND